jgi:hypothetical protein
MWVNQMQEAIFNAAATTKNKRWVAKVLRVTDKLRTTPAPKSHANLTFRTARKLKQDGAITT